MDATQPPAFLTVKSTEDADRYLQLVSDAAARTQAWIASHRGEPLDLLRRMKFELVGFHPIDSRPLNLIEQLNQTWTYAVALSATRELLIRHPEAGGFLVAPGAHMALELDIMSVAEGLVGAETFAATHPNSNQKLAKDLNKLSRRAEEFRYIFFSSPDFPGPRRWANLERYGVQVWSVAI